MNKLKFPMSVFIITCSLVMPTSINDIVTAKDMLTKSINKPITNKYMPTLINLEKTESYQKIANISYKAADLLAKRPLDLDQFCKNYPLNSLCIHDNTQLKRETEKLSVPMTEPKLTEQKSQVSQRKTSGWAITPEISTLGIGATVTKSITPNINAKVGISALNTDTNLKSSNLNYNSQIKLFNVSSLVDYHPWKSSSFRLTAGVIFQDNNIEGISETPNLGNIQIQGQQYNIANELQSLKAKVYFTNKVAPYIGIGWGNAVKQGNNLSFSANLGVMFPGSPKVDITAIGVNPNFLDAIQDNIEEERRQIENNLDWLNIYPVISFGVSYQF